MKYYSCLNGWLLYYPAALSQRKGQWLYIADTAIGKAEREIELIKEYKEAMISEAVMGKK
ncbi:MAG: hypothetical protein ACYCZO_02845 [Daejeonella sp.]